jgi:hypothetical protein
MGGDREAALWATYATPVAVVEWFPGFAFCRTPIWTVGRSFKFFIRHRSEAPRWMPICDWSARAAAVSIQ